MVAASCPFSSAGEDQRCAELSGSAAPGLGQRALRHGEGLGLCLFAAQAQRCADVHVESWTAQWSGEQPGHLFEGAAGCQCAGPCLAQGHDLGAGGVREMEEAGVKGPGRSLANALAVGETAFRVEQDGPARGQCRSGLLQRLGGSWVVPVNRDVPLPSQDTAEQGDAPQPRGRQHDGLGAEAAQRGEDDRRVTEGGVVGDDDAARDRPGSAIRGDVQAAEDGHYELCEATEHKSISMMATTAMPVAVAAAASTP